MPVCRTPQLFLDPENNFIYYKKNDVSIFLVLCKKCGKPHQPVGPGQADS
jgi:hypothetical protein